MIMHKCSILLNILIIAAYMLLTYSFKFQNTPKTWSKPSSIKSTEGDEKSLWMDKVEYIDLGAMDLEPSR